MNKRELGNSIMTRREVCQMLQVSRQTLINWERGGLIKGYRVLRNVYYKREEIEEALKCGREYSSLRKLSRRSL